VTLVRAEKDQLYYAVKTIPKVHTHQPKGAIALSFSRSPEITFV